MIEVKDFYKSYGKKIVHQGVSFSVNSGECLGLIGGSGAGKSVILRSIIGLEHPDSGKILVDEQDVTQMSESQLISIRKKVAYAFQGGALFDSMTVFDNLAYPLREHTKLSESEINQKVLRELVHFGLEGSEHLYPANLSGGMQKRVGLARAIILEPDYILYDEPTAGLDPFNTKKISDLILDLKHTGVTSILVTHDMPVALNVCDTIMLLLNGKICATVKTEELKNNNHPLISKFINGEAA